MKSKLNRAVDRLTNPHPSLKHKDRRRQSKLLSLILLVIITLGVVMLAGDLSYNGFSHTNIDTHISIAAVALLIICYILNRLGYYKTSSIMTIVSITAAVFVISIPSPSPDDIGMLYFIVIPMMFTSILLSPIFTIVYTIIASAGMFVFEAAVPGMELSQTPTITTMILGGLAVLASLHRSRLQEDRIEAIKTSERRSQEIVRNALEAFLLIDGESRQILEVNDETCRLFAIPAGELLDVPWNEACKRICGEEKLLIEQFQSGIAGGLQGKEKETELILNRHDQHKAVCLAKFTALPSAEKPLISISLIDITEQREKEKQLEFLATHDPLTRLPNRALCRDRLENAISRAKRRDTAFALILLDVDDFKQINDAYGHMTGDELIVEIGRRIKSCLRSVDTVARLGGDEFAVILEELGAAVRVLPVLQKLQKVNQASVHIQEREITVSLSMGISLYPQDGNTADNLIRYADSALYHAKSEGKNTYSFYKREMSSNIEHRLSLSHQLRMAVGRKEFFLEYQPQVNVRTGKIECYEALIRWNHPDKGRMSPAEFLPVAEDTGMIKDIGDWVLYSVFEKLRELRDKQITDIRLSLNVAGPQLIHGRILKTLREILRDIRPPAGSIEIELTENILFRDVQESTELVRELQSLGLRVAMDDFGDGYSTLHHLTTLPLDVLKIDQKFARRILDEKKNEAVVRGMAGIARDLGIDAVAEGIETKEQLDFFTSVGVGLIQGYYFSPPVAADLVERRQFSV